MKKKIVIIGCGFAGSTAAKILSRFKKEAEVIVIDKRQTFDFLPTIPDIIGRNIPPQSLTYPIAKLAEGLKFDFINEEVKGIDLSVNTVTTMRQNFNYDYLLIASGSETNFYGNGEIGKVAYRLDSVAAATAILEALRGKKFDSCVVAGGGYTGIEIASGLRMHFHRNALHKKITIVERAGSILGPLPEWMKAYTAHNLRNNLGVNIITDTVVDKAADGKVIFSDGRVFENTMLIWVAGVKTADFISGIGLEKNAQGRLKVDEYMKIRDNCFVAGDCANVEHRGNFLRMAVQFSIYGSVFAAGNIIRSIRGQELRKYRPIDVGYIIPMANNRSCGQVLGINVKGNAATALHFMMCIYRSQGIKNKLGLTGDLLMTR
ncbi:MAG: FAD-dependent oxidoreductase [Candidatus Omnitrophota bacterium]